jgi:hypothetical protein
MSGTDAPRRWNRSNRVVGAVVVALLALLTGPSLRPRLVAADATHHTSSTERSAAHAEHPLLRSGTTPRTHAAGTSPSPTASLSAAFRPGVASLVGPVSHEPPGGAGESPHQQPSSRGPPR